MQNKLLNLKCETQDVTQKTTQFKIQYKKTTPSKR